MGKGGGGGHTPVEARESGRSKQLVKIVEIISEGEIEGLADGIKSVYFDNTPVQNQDGSYNFENISLESRVGSQVQDLISGFNTSEKEISVGAQVRKKTPLTRTITDPKVSRLRLTLGVQSLFKQEDNGDTNGDSVNFRVWLGARAHTITFSGKYSSQFLRAYTFSNLPPVPFTVRVERVEEDSLSQRRQNNTVWSSYTEIIDTEFTYPNTALIGVKFDSEYFSNIPNRTYDIKGIKVKVPSNYDPKTRRYTGIWDGTFKLAWTDNPAWVLYDVVTNKRYGLGQRLGEFGADKWALYQVAQYCDQLVPDGFGHLEPRFTCNLWLTEQRSAYEVINDICSIFRAMPVWNGQSLTVVMDRPADPVWTYTNANVENGEFTYTFSAKKSRHNAIQVEYADKDNAYEKTIEYVSDDESIRKNGLNIKKVTAFGCTSRGQAHRTGLWLLQTEKLETKTVSFTVGAEGLMHTPGDIIKVADVDYAGTNIGGRVLAVNGTVVTLDREIDITANSYFSYINKEARHRDIKILSAKGNQITLDRPPEGLMDYGVWTLTTQRIQAQLFRAMSVKEEGKGKYSIVALQHEPQKEAIVDNGAKFEPKATTQLTLPKVNHIHLLTQSDGSILVDADVSGGAGSVQYDLRLYKDGQLFGVKLAQKSPALSIENLENGNYRIVIQARNEKGQLLNEQIEEFTIDRPAPPTGVLVTGGLGNITLSWDWVDDATATEIFVAETNDFRQATQLVKLTAKMFTHEVGARQVRYYWLRHVRGINNGPLYQLTGLRGESAVDIEAELQVLNEKLSQNIVNDVIDTALPARKLDLTLTVADIGNTAQYRGHKQVYNEKDGKLYTWNGKKYDSSPTEILASAIKGTIGVDQLAPIPTTKLTGQLNQNQIPNISANKIQGALSLAQVPAIPTTKLTGTIGANQLQANSIGANLIQANSIGTTHLQSNSVGAQQMQANSIGANAIQANAIGADKLQANSVTSAKIETGAIRANHVAAGEMTADKLAIGLGGNLLYNPIFANNAYGWIGFNAKGGDWTNCPATTAVERGYHPNDYHPKGEMTECWRLITLSGTQAQFNTAADRQPWVDVFRHFVNVVKDRWYMVSMYVGGSHCAGTLVVEKYSSDGKNYQGMFAQSPMVGAGNVSHKPNNFIDAPSGHFQYGLGQNAKRIFIKFKAPETGKILLLMRINAYAKNVTYADFYCARPMLEECTEHTREPSPWQNAGVTAIHGGSIVTKTITAQQIAANAVTANEIAAGAIAARHIAANSINAQHVVARSMTADKLSIGSLSAINSNIGTVTAGTITGTHISGNTIEGGSIRGTTITGSTVTGGTVKGTNIEGGTIRGTRLEGVSGKFTGELEVTQLIGGNLYECLQVNVNYENIPSSDRNQEMHRYWFSVKIAPSKANRIVAVVNSDIYKFVPANQSAVLHYHYKSVTRTAAITHSSSGIKAMVVAYVVSDAKTLSQ